MTIICGDCLEEMRKMGDNSISAIITDPPYGLSFMGKGWDHAVPGKEYWEECLRVVKPGGHLLAMGGTRTYHRLAVAIEDSGWEIRDTIAWIYGSGFPKSHNHFGIGGYGTALKPAHEPIIMAMKKCDGTFKQNAEKWGQAGINIDGCRVETKESWRRDCREQNMVVNALCERKGIEQFSNSLGRWPANVILDEVNERVLVLKDNIPTDIISVIQEYYCDYKLPDLPEKNKNVSKSNKKEQSTVLQSRVLLSCFDGEGEERKTPNVGKEAQGGLALQNEEESKYFEGESKSQISGPLVQSGLPYGEFFGTDGGSTENSKPNDEEAWHSGTSDNNGNVIESSVNSLGGCPSSEWSEGRQQDRKLRDDGQFNAQNGTQRDSQRTPRIEIRERALKVLACDVPEKWLKYFIETGEEVRSPHCAAEMLDEQSGISKSSDSINLETKVGGTVYGWANSQKHLRSGGHTDFGGASRFFYCAKASASERNEGTDKNNHPTVKPLKLMEYLIKMIMPPKDGILLDPFAGSGTTILAAHRLGMKAIGIERQPEYCEIANARLAHHIQNNLQFG